MPSKSKIKGSTFERDTAKMFNELFDTDQFSRAFGSGAFVGKSNWNKRSGMSQEVKNALAGDIMVPLWFPFNVECKHYDKSPIYHKLLSPEGDSKMDEWLGKSIHDSINTKTLPLVVFKTTRIFTGMALPYMVLESIDIVPQHYCTYKKFIIVDIDTGKNIITSFVKVFQQSENHLINSFLDFIEKDDTYQTLLKHFTE